MYAALAVDQLRDAEIDSVAGKEVCFFAGQLVALSEEHYHVAEGVADGDVEFLIEAHGHEMRRGFGARPLQAPTLVDGETKVAGERRFESR